MLKNDTFQASVLNNSKIKGNLTCVFSFFTFYTFMSPNEIIFFLSIRNLIWNTNLMNFRMDI